MSIQGWEWDGYGYRLSPFTRRLSTGMQVRRGTAAIDVKGITYILESWEPP
jgi:hypothetical protein